MAKKTKKLNTYDVFIDNLIGEFVKIPNLNLSFEDEQGKKIFNFSVKRIAELTSYRSLFINYYLNAASKAVVDDLGELRKSKYKNYLVITEDDLKENLYDTIRLGYIGLFHKYENFIDELISMAEMLIGNDDNSYNTPLQEYSIKEFDFKIKDWKFSSFIERINWIAICNKHYDGYPRKTPKPLHYNLDILFPEEKKMKLSKGDFKKDSQMMIDFYPQVMQLVFLIALHKMMFDNDDIENYKDTAPDLHEKMVGGKKMSTEQIKKLIKLFHPRKIDAEKV